MIEKFDKNKAIEQFKELIIQCNNNETLSDFNKAEIMDLLTAVKKK